MSLRGIRLKERIARAHGATPAEAGAFFGWTPKVTTKQAAEFIQEELVAAGWTEEVLEDIADGYEQVAQLRPNNPSALGRARQLREIVKHCFASQGFQQ